MQELKVLGLELWQTLEAEVHQFSYASCIFSGLPCANLNKIIVYQDISKKDFLKLQDIAASKNLPYSWLVPSHIVLKELGISHFYPSLTLTAMALTLDTFSEMGNENNLCIDQVETEADLKETLLIWQESFSVNDAAFKMQSEHILQIFQKENSHIQFFLGRVHDKPMSAGWLLLGKEYAGIYNIGTKCMFRKKGAATNMMHRLVLEAKKRGYKKALLSALPEAKAIYKRIGFESIENYILYKKIVATT